MSDYIKREDVIKEINDFRLGGAPDWIETEIEYVFEAINEIPAADVLERKRGKWEFDNPITADYMCSVCLERNDVCTPFCPNCGADMGWWSDDDV